MREGLCFLRWFLAPHEARGFDGPDRQLDANALECAPYRGERPRTTERGVDFFLQPAYAWSGVFVISLAN